MNPLPVEPRIRKYSEINSDGCWIWTKRIQRDGYGVISVLGRSALAHRASYEALVGPIPEGLALDHLCRVRSCVNPEHLEPVTHLENQARGLRSHTKQVCVNGHAYTEENTYRRPSNGKRQCRACTVDYQRRYLQRKSAS